MLSDSPQSTCVGVDWDGILFKFHSNPPQRMWIDANLATSKQGLRVLLSSLVMFFANMEMMSLFTIFPSLS
jgi:hypothetical protein